MPNYPTYKLGEVVDIYSGFGFPKHLQGRKTGKYPFFKVGDISKNVQAGYKHLNFCENYIDDDELRLIKGVLLPISSIVFAKIGEALKLNRRAITTNLCLIDNNAIGVKSKTEMCDDLYLYYYLTTIKLEDYSRATTVPSVRKSDIEQIPIHLPPLATQRTIVTRIETLFAELDKGVEKLKTAQQQLKVYRQAVLNDCLTKGSEKWNCIEIEKVADVVSGYAFKSNLFKEVGTFQVIRIGNVKPGKIRKNENPVFYEDVPDKVLEKTLLKCNDVVITLTGTRKKRDYGFTALIDCENLLLNQRLAYFRFNQSIYNPKFFLYYTWTDLFKDDFFSYETGNVGQGNVGVKAITKTKIPLPSLPEQQRIVQEIETRLSACDEVEKQIAESLQQAEVLRQSILKKAFSGELV